MFVSFFSWNSVHCGFFFSYWCHRGAQLTFGGYKWECYLSMSTFLSMFWSKHRNANNGNIIYISCSLFCFLPCFHKVSGQNQWIGQVNKEKSMGPLAYTENYKQQRQVRTCKCSRPHGRTNKLSSNRWSTLPMYVQVIWIDQIIGVHTYTHKYIQMQ